MIVTVTLNPAIDKTIEINDFEVNKVNRISSSRIDVGGKGINVSKVLNALGGHSLATGFIGGSTGEIIKNYLDDIKIKSNFVKGEKDTRTNIKVVDKILGSNTDINESGAEVSVEELEDLEKIILENASPENIIVFAGSIPKNLPKSIYRRLIEVAKSRGAKTILDADGELFLEGINAKPYMVKPNNFELENIFGKKLTSIEDIKEAGEKLLDMGIEKVIISLGGDGALFLSKENKVHGLGIKVKVESTVGAGDSMVAALALGEEKNLDIEELVKLTIATSAAAVTTKGTQAASIELINELKKSVLIKNI